MSYRALNRITKPFSCLIGRCNNAVDNLGDGAGVLYFISIDCAEGYNRINVYWKDQEKLAFFGSDGNTWTFTVTHFGRVNASPVYTAMI